MPIERIELENFQAHKDTSLELSPGMNVIWGETDHGKSSIIRGIRWVVLNRPQGDEFRRHETKKTQVTLRKDKRTVQRRKTNTKNEYRVSGIKDPLKALRTDIPEEVHSILNLSEANIQSQHEVYFLVDKSPGQRSKILNEVAGLQIMDKVLKQTNSEIRQLNSDIKTVNELLEEDQQKILELNWVNSADKFLSKLEKYEKDIKEKEKFYEGISFIIYQIEELELLKSEFMSYEDLNEIDKLIMDEAKIKELERYHTIINNTIWEIKNLELKLDKIDIIDTSELEKLQYDIDSLTDKYERIEDIIDEIKFRERQHKQLKSDLAKTEIKIKKELKRLGECPTCGSKI